MLIGGLAVPRALSQSTVSLRQDVNLAANDLRVWKDGAIRYFLFDGNCLIEQGLQRIRSEECLAWLDESKKTVDRETEIHIIAKGNVRGIDISAQKEYVGVFRTRGRMRVQPDRKRNESVADHPLVQQARQIQADDAAKAKAAEESVRVPRKLDVNDPDFELTGSIESLDDVGIGPSTLPKNSLQKTDPNVENALFLQNPNAGPSIQLVQYESEPANAPAEQAPASAPGNFPVPADPDAAAPSDPNAVGIVNVTPPTPRNDDMTLTPGSTTGARRVRAFPRSGQPFHADSFKTERGDQVFVFTGGINIIVEELDTGMVVDVVADRIVIWTRGGLLGEISGNGARTEGKQPLEMYLEGNVYVRQGNPAAGPTARTLVVAGKQCYFNVNTNQALILDGTVETYDEVFQTPIYMKADQIYQLTQSKFYGEKGLFTTSPYRGTPGYSFQSRGVVFEQVSQPVNNPFTGDAIIDPKTDKPMVRNRFFATGFSNFFEVEDFPIFYWPYVRADVQDPLGPIEGFNVGNSHNLGTFATLNLDAWQLLGLDYLPIADSTNWLLDLGYYNQRGIAGGSRFNYLGNEMFGVDGKYYGDMLTWWINDHGLDNLGNGRQGIAPPRDLRGRLRAQHHHELPHDMTLIAETSYLSDANLLDSFYEVEYDTGKDQDTVVYLKQQRDNWAWTGMTQARINQFLPQNQWLPRFDGYLLGIPLLEDRLTYFQRSTIGYGEYLPPTQYALPQDVTVKTGRFDTRHEINLPTNIGPWQVTPFLVGEFGAYSDAVTANGLGRVYGAGGIRTSLPFWRIYPEVESHLFNVHGLAHKMALNIDYFYAMSNLGYWNLPELEQVDDDTSELVRRQNYLRTFGGYYPQRFDPRFYALRTNAIFYPEILGNMQNVRIGLDQRLQTKRGPIENRRILDWMTFNAGTTLYPNADRDNFGTMLGFVDANYLWNIGDRTALQSGAVYQPPGSNSSTAPESLQYNIVMSFIRPPRATLSTFYSHFNSGPFQSDFVGAGTSYRFSQKYAGSLSSGYDFYSPNNVSFNFLFTRVGLDFITNAGFVLNAGRKDFGFQFSIIPRVQARSQFGRSNVMSLPFGVDPSESVAPISQDRLNILNTNTIN